MNVRTRIALPLIALVLVLTAGACDDGDPVGPADRPFLEGAGDDPQIGVVVNSLGRSLTLFQLGDPGEQRTVALGASSSVTPVGLSIRGSRAAVPLGNAASTALIDLESRRTERFFLFPEGNATGSAFVGDGALLVANLLDDYVGRVELDQEEDAIAETVDVTPAPTWIEVRDGRAWVLSANLDEESNPEGDGVVTALDPATLEVEGTVSTGGTNPQDAAFGPDGLLYVVNAGDYASPGTMAILDPATMERVELVEGMGTGPGSITIGDDGLAYVSGFFFGTVVWDTDAGKFVRGPDDPVCAPLEDGGCRGATDADVDASGRLYQAFFGSPQEDLDPWIFVYEPDGFTLTDSIATGAGPTAVQIRSF